MPSKHKFRESVVLSPERVQLDPERLRTLSQRIQRSIQFAINPQPPFENASELLRAAERCR